MKTLKEIWQQLANQGYETDKGSIHSYVQVYEELLAPYRESKNPLLEIGLFQGNSLRMWERYFFYGNEVYGVDASETPHNGLADLRPMIEENVHNIYILDAANESEVRKTFDLCKFQIIIEDANHDVNQQIAMYNIWKKYLAPNGIYIIEDVQDLDNTRHLFKHIDEEKRVTIIDNREVKNRYDDVLILITDK